MCFAFAFFWNFLLWFLADWNIRTWQNLKSIYNIKIYSTKHLVFCKHRLVQYAYLLFYFLGEIYLLSSLGLFNFLKKINNLKGLKHTILHICFFLQSNLKLQRSLTCYLWILRASPHIFFGAIVVSCLVSLCRIYICKIIGNLKLIF